MNNQNISQENIELESHKIELQVSEINLENKQQYEIGITTPPPEGIRLY